MSLYRLEKEFARRTSPTFMPRINTVWMYALLLISIPIQTTHSVKDAIIHVILAAAILLRAVVPAIPTQAGH